MREGIRTQNYSFLYWIAGLGFAFLAVYLYLLLIADNSMVTSAFLQIIELVIDLIVMVVLLTTAILSSRRSQRISFVWGFIALSMFCFALRSFASGFELLLGATTNGLLVSILQMGFYPLFALGILWMPRKHLTFVEGIKKNLDNIMLMLVAGLAYLEYMAALMKASPLIAFDLGRYLIPSVLDLFLLCVILLVIDRVIDRQSKASIMLLFVAVLILLITDSIIAYLSLQRIYITGSVWELGRVLAYLTISLAGMLQALLITSEPGTEIRFYCWSERMADRMIMLGPYVPYFWLVGAYVLLAGNVLSPLEMTFTYLVASIIGLTVLRMLVAFIESNRAAYRQQEVLEKNRQELFELSQKNRELFAQINEYKQAAKQMTLDALHDWQTGLPNRALVTDRLGQVVEYSRQRPDYVFSVLALDIDQYKMISDSFGTAVADELVVAVAQRLTACVRSSDTVARIDHDEFIILLENTIGEDFVYVMVSRLREALEPPFTIEGQQIYVTPSIGAVMSLQDYNMPDEIMGDAEAAKNRAKSLGSGRFEIFNPTLRIQATSRLELESDLRHALLNHEFQLYYQPIFTLYSNKVMGFEALIRWFHPKRGMINPADFIPMAEESGLIIPIGNWVIEEACTQISKWHEKFPGRQNVSINVNISGKQLIQVGFIEYLQEVLLKTNLKGISLKLEITESSLIDNFDQANVLFQQLGEMDVKLEIDDFGTGYSSLGYLQNFPFNTIKIDKSFIDKIGKGGKGTEIIRATILMANELGLETIAEGVETMEQLQELRNMSCHYVQGYLMSPPLDAISAESYLVKAVKTGRLAPLEVLPPRAK
jgi:diguanylate cyclase (GGDEF)-like protein